MAHSDMDDIDAKTASFAALRTKQKMRLLIDSINEKVTVPKHKIRVTGTIATLTAN